jgi:hypothetical protein
LLFPYHLGVAERLAEEPGLLEKVACFSGTSGGALTAALLCCAPGKIQELKEYVLSGRITEGMSWTDLWDPARLLPSVFHAVDLFGSRSQGEDAGAAQAALAASNARLEVSVTARNTRRNKRVRHFGSVESLMATLQASCSFAFSGVLLADGGRYWDGGISDSGLIMPSTVPRAPPSSPEPTAPETGTEAERTLAAVVPSGGGRTAARKEDVDVHDVVSVCPMSCSNCTISPRDDLGRAGRAPAAVRFGQIRYHLSWANVVRGWDVQMPGSVAKVRRCRAVDTGLLCNPYPYPYTSTRVPVTSCCACAQMERYMRDGYCDAERALSAMKANPKYDCHFDVLKWCLETLQLN